MATLEQKGGRDIPSDFELPDLTGLALAPLSCYEPVFVDRHKVPHVGNNGTIETGGYLYWKRPNGKRCAQATLDQAKVMIAQQMAEDEAATADLI